MCGSGTDEHGLPITCFLSNFWGLAMLRKLGAEVRIFRDEVGLVTFILKFRAKVGNHLQLCFQVK